ncbi:hypothetical protein GCM10010495_24380 [Kitasatospora herbaricolor]|nr:hypothetical protein GCM10010495_24380 [Kitasatospora herbaricolor]
MERRGAIGYAGLSLGGGTTTARTGGGRELFRLHTCGRSYRPALAGPVARRRPPGADGVRTPCGGYSAAWRAIAAARLPARFPACHRAGRPARQHPLE